VIRLVISGQVTGSASESERNNAAVAKHCNWVSLTSQQFFPDSSLELPACRAVQWSLKMCLNMQIVRFVKVHYSFCFIVGPNNVDATRYLQRRWIIARTAKSKGEEYGITMPFSA
jgi:hypothetical protein